MVVAYDVAALGEAAEAVTGLARRVDDLADGAGTAACASGAAAALAGSRLGTALTSLVEAALEVDRDVAAALNGLSEALERVAAGYVQQDAAASAALAATQVAPAVPSPSRPAEPWLAAARPL